MCIVDPVDYLRDVVAYVLVLVLIVVVAYDGKVGLSVCLSVCLSISSIIIYLAVFVLHAQVTLAEAICFPLLYILYIGSVIALTYLKVGTYETRGREWHDL